MERVDIIIPAFHAQNTIIRPISSIVMQNIIDEIDITIVNDADENDYSEFVNYFKKFVSIKEIKMSKNGGPGVARQYGLDHTNNEYVTFIDADDSFASPFAIKELRRQLDGDPKSHTCVGTFIEEQILPDGTPKYLPHQQDMVWMFGKMYTRSFLKRYDIHFNETRANEDNGFNALVKLCSSENEQIKFIGDVVYDWHINDNSITRIDNCNYSYNASFPGYTDNMIYAIIEGKKRKPFNGYITQFSIETMCNLYEYYIETVARDKRYMDQNFSYCKKFYDKVYSKIEEDITPEILSTVYNNIMRNAYMGNKLNGIIPHVGLLEFIQELKTNKPSHVKFQQIKESKSKE
jgi:glycosyltransferase involved in cell wall biosynthesis